MCGQGERVGAEVGMSAGMVMLRRKVGEKRAEPERMPVW